MSLFSNQSVPIDALPTLVEEEFEGLPARYRTLRAAVYAGVMLLLFAGIGMLMWFEWREEGTFRWGVWVAFGAVLLIGLGWAIEEIKGFPLRGVLVREHDLSYRSGFFKQEMVTVPFNRIQHSEIQQGPMGRWLGYCTLKLYTAGASGANLEIPGLSTATARNIRRMLEDLSHE